MKASKPKTILCLLISVALVAGMLSGCQPSQENPSSSPTSTNASDPTDPTRPGITFGPGYTPPYTPPWDSEWCATPNDTYYTNNLQWAIDNIHLPDAWDITTGSGTIRVGVIDSGIDASHPDLQHRVNTAFFLFSKNK